MFQLVLKTHALMILLQLLLQLQILLLLPLQLLLQLQLPLLLPLLLLLQLLAFSQPIRLIA
jgi:hypothetical protein